MSFKLPDKISFDKCYHSSHLIESNKKKKKTHSNNSDFFFISSHKLISPSYIYISISIQQILVISY